MEQLASREDSHFHNQSFNQPNPLHNFIDKPSIIRAQLTPKPPRRDASFTAFLKPNDNLLSTEANHHVNRTQDSEISIFEAEKYFNGAHEPKNRNTNGVYTYTMSNSKQADIHIPNVGRLSLSTPKQSVSSVSRLSSVSDDSYGRNYRARSFHATPTASSEASWNSQTGLLTNPPGLAPVSIRNLPSTDERTSKKSGSWFLRGNICPCSGKKSVKVKQPGSERETSKIPPTPPRIVQLNRISSSGGSAGYLYSSSQSSPHATRATLIPEEAVSSFVARPQSDQSKVLMTSANSILQREQSFQPIQVAGGGGTGNGFTFPVLSNKADPAKRSFSNVQPPFLVTDSGISAGETPRDSIEIFQPRESPKSRRASYDDDMCSDASSDLFEIESFSAAAATQTTLFPRRDSLEDPATNFNVRRLRIAPPTNKSTLDDVEEPVTPSIAPTECYAPSEVSVDWSVTTAEGFDRASLAAFSVSASELGYAALKHPTKFAPGADDNKRKTNGGLLTSCICEKAVNVGPNPIKYQTETRVHGRSQAPIRAKSTDSHGIARSTLMPAQFGPESLAHRRSM